MSSDKIIEINNLTKRFKSLVAVDNLSLNVYSGDVFGFLGPNGAGKSTTIRMLLTLINPTSGKIKIFDKDLNQNRKQILSKVGAIVEKPDFYLYLTAYKNLEILGKISGADISKKNIMQILELVGLESRYNSKVKTYSHGMKQRLGIAQTLLHDPQLIILDEPTTGLDPHGMKEIRDLIMYLSKEKGKTILLSSHILREIELIASRMIIINKGSSIIEGKVEELLNADQLKVRVEVNNINEVCKKIEQSIWKIYFKGSDEKNMLFEIDKALIPSLTKYLVQNNVDVNAIVPIRSLEDYFLRITGERT